MREFFRWFLLPFLIGLGLGLARHARAEEPNNLCASYIGICSKHWPCGESLKVFRGLPVKRLGYLAVTFGKGCPCVKRFLELPGEKELRVQLINGTCFRERGRVCGPDEVFFGESIQSADRKLAAGNKDLLARVDRALTATRAVVPHDTNDTVKLAGLCLECPLGMDARRAILRRAKLLLPDFVFVDSVLTQPCIPGLVCEKHGFNPPCGKDQTCIADTDGADFREMDGDAFLRATSDFVMACLWTPSFNLLDPARQTFQDPRERRAKPTRAHFEELRYWLLERVVLP